MMLERRREGKMEISSCGESCVDVNLEGSESATAGVGDWKTGPSFCV